MSLTVDFARGCAFQHLFQPTILKSSKQIGWQEIYVEEHQKPAWETPVNRPLQHIIVIYKHRSFVPAERQFEGKRQVEQLGSGNTVIIPSMTEHQVCWSQDIRCSLLVLDPNRMNQIAYESTGHQPIELIPQHAMFDPFIEQVGRSLTTELEQGQPGCQLFAEALTTMLGVHLLRNYSTYQKALRHDEQGLTKRQLQQAIDYIQAHLREGLTIAAIASQIEMSHYHFTRLFKQSMGLAPYQYVIQQRLQLAQVLLKTTTLTMSAIAHQAGFSNQNQMSIQFRQRLGITPSQYRSQQ